MLYDYEPLRNIGLERAWSLIKEKVMPLGTEFVEARLSAGRVSAEDLVSPVDFPSEDISHADGFAVRIDDAMRAPVRLRLRMQGESVGVGEAVFVRTGEPVPDGAGAVVPVEHAMVSDGEVLLKRPPRRGQEIIARGMDIGRGEMIVSSGEKISHYHLKAILEAGYARVRVYRSPSLTVIPTGDEYARGERVESLGPVTCSILASQGYRCRLEPPVPDDPREIAGLLEEALRESDVVATIGGSSIGLKDHSWRAAMGVEGAEPLFRGLRMQPGKVTSMLVVKGKPVVLLPGFVQSHFTALTMILLPVLRRMEGVSDIRAHAPMGRAVLEEDLFFEEKFVSYTRLRLVSLEPGESWFKARVHPSVSYIVSSIYKANGLILVSPGTRSLSRGDSVAVYTVPGLLAPVAEK